MRGLISLFALVMVIAGCSSPPAPVPTVEPKSELPAGMASVPMMCRILDEQHRAMAGSCTFHSGAQPTGDGRLVPEYSLSATTDAAGIAQQAVPLNKTIVVVAQAEGRPAKAVRLESDLPKAITFTLGNGTAPAMPEDFLRTWSAPVTIDASAGGSEPQVAVDSKGVVYYMTASGFDQASKMNTGLYRSDDGGKTFKNASPQPTAAAPTVGSDDSLSIAPDDSVWFSRYIGYPENTIGCTSADKGATWTCDQAAIPGPTDRMWIVGLSKTEGYLQSNEGLEQPDWVHTTTGSLKYLPYATAAQVQQHGNMVYDAKNKAVWQVTTLDPPTDAQGTMYSPTLSLMRVDGVTGVVDSVATNVPRTYAINWLAAYNGTLWTTGEANVATAPSVQVAYSSDSGKSWVQTPVTVMPKAATFSYVAAGPGIAGKVRAAAVYYGSDVAKPSPANGGQWSLYVAESNDATAPDATWVETRVAAQVHKGNICIGLNCEQTGGDTAARDAGDLIGIAMDPTGNAHLSYVDFQKGAKADYLRQATL